MIVDAHIHLYDEAGYAEKLLHAMDQCGIDKSCISGLGHLFGFGTNDDVLNAFKKWPDRFIGAFFIRPGIDGAEKIKNAYEAGFKIVKVTLPKSGYDDKAYYPLWQKASELGMPVLFHTGIVACKDVPGEDVSSWNMHPLRIDPISREFSTLKIIVAHLGMNWNMDAAELARMRPNVYVDLTGEPEGWRKRLDAEGADKYLWWPDAFNKVVFGTDVHYTKIATIFEQDRKRLAKFGIRRQIQDHIFSHNILSMLATYPV